ncbi:MAG: hypothetical protein J6F31_00555 [Oscillospiraceae bacterium]|nr:hypothetical protein [Oscillospiraceae bacterium]
MSIKISQREYGNFGKCVFLENGSASVGITLDVGPRIIYFSLKGKENIMLEDRERYFTEKAGEYGEWVNYGGHRLWCAPEVNPETYSPDNAPVSCKADGSSVTLTPPPTPFGKAFSVTVSMDEEKPLVSITHRIKNVSDRPARYAAWAITGLTVNGVLKAPLSRKKTGYLGNRVLSLWDYSDINDPRFKMTNTEIRLRQDTFKKNAFKCGFNVDEGFVSYSVNGQTFVKSVPDYDPDRCYPDFSCNFETYTNSLFLECENIGEYREYAPGEEAVLSEKWFLLDNEGDEEPELDRIKNSLENTGFFA